MKRFFLFIGAKEAVFYLSLATFLCFLPLFLTAPKNIFAFLLSIALTSHFFINKKIEIEANRLGLLGVGFFLFALLLSSSLSIMPFYSIKMVFKHYFVAFLITFGFLVSLKNEKHLTYTIYSLALLTIVADIYYYLDAVRQHYSWNIATQNFHIDRNYSYVLPLLLPFLFSAFMLSRNKWIKGILLIGVLGSIVLALLTGRRAGYFSISMEALLFLFLSFRIYAGKIKRTQLIAIMTLLFLATGTIFYAVSQTRQFQNALERGLSPNGRDVIIQDRFDTLKKYFLFGAGYGKAIYNEVLEADHIPKRFGRWEHGSFNYFDDEGTYIQTLFRTGLLGFAALLIFLLYPLLTIVKQKPKISPCYLTLFSIAVLTFEQYLLRGFVSTFILSNLLPFFAIYLRSEKICKRETDLP
ncbi:O-antigen ligase family protein [Hydrogenimonas sp.]